jgi:hypothetical protein
VTSPDLGVRRRAEHLLLRQAELVLDRGRPVTGDGRHHGLLEAELLVVAEVGDVNLVLGSAGVPGGVPRVGLVEHDLHLVDDVVPGLVGCSGGPGEEEREDSGEDDGDQNSPHFPPPFPASPTQRFA